MTLVWVFFCFVLFFLIYLTDCPASEISIARDETLNLTSYGYPYRYQNNMLCNWTVECQDGGRILVEFLDFQTERDFDYLYIGTEQDSRVLTYNGYGVPELDVVSPPDGSPLYFLFYTDGSVTDPGWHIRLTNVGDQGKKIFQG